MILVDLDEPCGVNFVLRDLVEAGETWSRTRVPNVPRQAATVDSIRRLVREILDPVVAEFGPIEITYGFASPALTRLIPGCIDPARDQHAGHELNANGAPICPRLGQAVDFWIKGISSGRVAAWIAQRLPFDRIYFYGRDCPLHVSIGPEEKRAVIAMLPGPSGRRVPALRSATWLEH
ncbi:hypothetical protein [Falsiroseomonas sp. CW058]|uniref:hypothetical protein n=1 Tax=Falsiroseomonas sp. CW058 TaxID=3388664 RepID=UPI003D3226AD